MKKLILFFVITITTTTTQAQITDFPGWNYMPSFKKTLSEGEYVRASGLMAYSPIFKKKNGKFTTISNGDALTVWVKFDDGNLVAIDAIITGDPSAWLDRFMIQEGKWEEVGEGWRFKYKTPVKVPVLQRTIPPSYSSDATIRLPWTLGWDLELGSGKSMFAY